MKEINPSTKVFLSKSRVSKAGRGVFARTPIKKNEIIECCPIILITGKDVSVLKQTELKNYYFIWHEPKKVATKIGICLGFGSLYNHSYTPNATYRKKIKENLIEFIAISDIQKGEEISVNYNYGKPDDKSTLWIKTIKPYTNSDLNTKS